MSVNDVVDLFEQDEKPVEDKKDDLLEEEKPEIEEDKEEKKKEEEIELEEEIEKIEPDEADLELVTPVKRQEILKAYPDLFKKFPYLEKAYYREQAYTELLPTIDDAKEAIEARDSLRKFESDLLSGDTLSVLQVVKKTDEAAFAKIVDNYLPALAKVDQNAYFHILGNINKAVIRNMVQEADRTKNDELKSAAVILNQFIFGGSEYTPPAKFSKEPDTNPEADQLKKEREDFKREKLTSVASDLQTRTDNSINNTIVNHIDPKGVMTEYVRRNAIREAKSMLEEVLAQDSRFNVHKDKLWEKAIESNFSPLSTKAIQTAYLGKAKAYLPSIIAKARNEALKGQGKRESTTEEREEKKGPLPAGKAASPRNSSQNNNGPSGKENASKGKKTMDYFMED